VRGAHAKGSPRALISQPPPLDRLPEPPCPVRSRHRKPNPRSSATAVGFLPPPSLRRREVAKEPRKEVSNAPAPQVVECVLRRDQETSPEFTAAPNPRRRVERSPRRLSAITAAPTSLASQRASRGCPPRPHPWPETLDLGS
jgi:hypothetical protein